MATLWPRGVRDDGTGHVFMTYEEAVEVLSDYRVDNNGIHSLSPYVGFKRGQSTICLDGDFTADELEAFLVIMRFEDK